jgi:hypothetical protein
VRVRELKEEFPWTTEQTESRSPGIHLTEAIHRIAETMYHTQAVRMITPEAKMQWEKGWLWETALSQAFGEKAAIRPGEVELDGVIGSPDGVMWDDNGGLVVEEYKCTTFSSNKSPTDVWKWMMQVKGYCKMLGKLKCVFRILHLDFVPVYKVWEIEFTQGEVDENWVSIMAGVEMIRRKQ